MQPSLPLTAHYTTTAQVHSATRFAWEAVQLKPDFH